MELQIATMLVEKVLRYTGQFLIVLLPVIGILGGVHLLLDFLFNVVFRRIR